MKPQNIKIKPPTWRIAGSRRKLNEYELRCAMLMVSKGDMPPFNVVCADGSTSRMRPDGIFMDELPGIQVADDLALALRRYNKTGKLAQSDASMLAEFTFAMM